MSDYITKDEVLTLLNPNDTRISETYIALVREEIKLRPSADVEPVRHGRWLSEGTGYNWVHRCSVCGYKNGYVFDELNYCPYCGARMDGGNNE